MIQLSIPLPTIPGTQDIDLEITVNGEKQKLHYKVQFLEWKECDYSRDDRIKCIQDKIQEYGNEWMIYNIGLPGDKYVPLTFIKTEDWMRQRQWNVASVLSGQLDN